MKEKKENRAEKKKETREISNDPPENQVVNVSTTYTKPTMKPKEKEKDDIERKGLDRGEVVHNKERYQFLIGIKSRHRQNKTKS